MTPAELLRIRDGLLIDTDAGPRPFATAADPWQRSDLAAITPGWLRMMGFGGAPEGKQRAYLERPRGHSKTADLALLCAFALAFAQKPIRGIAAAADQDQARLLRDAIQTLVRLNPILDASRSFTLPGLGASQGMLDVQAYKVVNVKTGSALEIISSDAGSSYGLTPDFEVVDELTHWKSEELWSSLVSSAAKRANCVCVVISNAGFGAGSSWQWRAREACRTDPAWHFSRLDGPSASWITTERLAEQQRLLPALAFRRLWMNEWTSGAGDAINDDDLTAAITASGPMTGDELGWTYYLGIDLGLSRDHSAAVCVGVHSGYEERVEAPDVPAMSTVQEAMIDLGYSATPRPKDLAVWHEGTGRVRLARCMSWIPPKGGKVDLPAIETAILTLHNRFNFVRVFADSWQAEMLCQRLRSAGLPVEGIAMTSATLQGMASALLEALSSRTIDLFNQPDLLADLRRLRVIERQAGIRLDATRTAEGGHADRATALCLALLAARRYPIFGPARVSGDLFLYPRPQDFAVRKEWWDK